MIFERVEHSIAVRVTVAGHRNDYTRIGNMWFEDWGSGLEVANHEQDELDRLYKEWCRKEGGGEA